MEPGRNGSNDPTPLDRIERIIEVANVTSDMQRDLKIVLGAQAVMSEAIVKLTAEVRTGLAQLAEA